ncbi:MAG: glycosyltransferase family 1 protein [Muribaculaceae bacterium]|nr:glycosyltransferase family 1 protein [Muribaculaceae bacterium]
MKILFVGDGSNMHNCLAQELRARGHEACVASDGSRWMNTGRDIDLLRKPGSMGTLAYLGKLLRALSRMRNYDVVQLSGLIFLQLRPERLSRVFDYLRRHNRLVVYSAMGTDVVYHDACHDGHTFRYSDYMVGSEPSPYVGSGEYRAQHQDNWRAPFMRAHSDHVLAGIDGAVACLYEYYVPYVPLLGERVAYAGIPVDTCALPFHPIAEEPSKVRFFIGIQPDRTVIKGTDRLLQAARRVCDRYPRLCELDVAERLPLDEYTRRMRGAHVLLDQLYSYTPATNALMAMAQGLVAVSGGEPEYYELIGERHNRPVVNVDPTVPGDIDARLEWLVRNKRQLPAMSRAGRDFVEKHNAAPVVAQRYLDFWAKIASMKG